LLHRSLASGDRVAQRASNNIATKEHAGSAARMMLRVQVLQALARHVRVDRVVDRLLCPSRHLHRAQVRAVIEQVGRKAWRKVCGEISLAMPPLRA